MNKLQNIRKKNQIVLRNLELKIKASKILKHSPTISRKKLIY